MVCKPVWISTAAFIARLPLFEGLAPEELTDIAGCTRKISAVRGEMLFHKNEACSGLFLVVHGQVKLFFSSPLGNEKILGVFGPDQTLGESALLQGKTYQTYAQTLSDCTLLHIAKPAILAALDRNSVFARRIIDRLSQSIAGLTEEVESYSLCSARQRVVKYLLREALHTRPGADENRRRPLVISLPTSKGVIASCLNITPQHFSRILNSLSAGGLLSVCGRNIRIENLPEFWRYADDALAQPDAEAEAASGHGRRPSRPRNFDTSTRSTSAAFL